MVGGTTAAMAAGTYRPDRPRVGDILRRGENEPDWSSVRRGMEVRVVAVRDRLPRGYEVQLLSLGNDWYFYDRFHFVRHSAVEPMQGSLPIPVDGPIFKVGDRVRIIGNNAAAPDHFLGKEVTIKSISDRDFRVVFFVEDGRYYFYAEDLEHLTKGKSSVAVENFRSYVLSKEVK